MSLTTTLLIGDIHLNKKNPARSQALLANLRAVIGQHRPDRVIQLGDVFHNHGIVHVEFLRMYYEFLTSLAPTPYIQLVGNHDMANSVTLFPKNHALVPFNAIDHIVVVDKPYVQPHELFLPYIPTGQFWSTISQIEGGFPTPLIYCHQEFKGSVQPEAGDQLPLHGLSVISGHIHNSVQLSANCWYPGTPIQHDFGDDDNKAVYLLTQDENMRVVHKQAITLDDMPRFRTIRLNTSGTMPIFDTASKDLIRYEITGSKEDLYVFKKSQYYKDLECQGCIKTVTITGPDKPQVQAKSFSQLLVEACKAEGVEHVYNQVIAV